MKPFLSLIFATTAPLHAGLTSLGEHVDIRWRWEAAGGWTCQAITDSKGEVAHPLDGVFLPLADKPYVNQNPGKSGARFTQPASPAFAFTGVPAGQPLWVAVQSSPGIGEAWPGLENNQLTGTFGNYIPADPRVSQSSARRWIRIELDSHTPPPGTNAHFSLWTNSGSTPTVWMSTFESNTVNHYYLAEGTHNHVNWGFSAPGIHRVRLKASAFAGPGATNPIGPSAAYTLTFAIGPFAQWQATHFSAGELDHPSICGPEADPDQDGMKNLVEFGFGFDPRSGVAVPETAGLGLPKWSTERQSGILYHVLEYPARRAGAQISPLAYLPEFSSNMVWQSSGITVTTSDFPLELDSLNKVWEKVTARRPAAATAPSCGFGRVGVLFGD